MTASHLMSTDEVPLRDRAPVWREWVWRHFGGLDSDLYGDSEFDGHIAASRAGDVILTRLEANRHRVLRTQQMARTSEAAYLKIVAPWQGFAEVVQRGRQAAVRTGATRAITDITLSSGFSNLSHFSRVFRAHTGGSPSEFRRQLTLRHSA